MRPVDYDDRLHRGYAAGRALTGAQRAAWARAFAARLLAVRPLRGLDLGSGTGRFAPLLAAEFGGPVTGVEPSRRMREQAVAHAAHPRVAYVPGRAEALPLPDGAVDFGLSFLVWHHVRDKPAGARELHRVLRPGGTLLLRTELTDRLPALWYIDAFPRGREILGALYEPLSAVRATFEAAGWELASVAEVELPAPGTWAEALARLRTRAFSVFEHMREADVDAGFAELERRVAAAPRAPAPVAPGTLLTLRRA
ncbi:class I SAM-dependent methyltransferase [Streptomyces synnematoformans]|uniref:Methyltransferase type 11 domain-containing protein n=1 Tax=Streptomyces synnematoformans TaxID=415721 RepID=A0ABN2Y153_9ACTN